VRDQLEWPKLTRGGYELEVNEHPARLVRVTTVLEWTIKGDGFGAMSYFGGGLFANFLFPDLDDEEREGVLAVWKESAWDPNRKLKADGMRGQQAHTLFERLCQHKVELLGQSDALGDDYALWNLRHPDGKEFLVEGYDAGVCKAYHEIFQHLDPEELMSETRVHWTEHPIDECPDEVCNHGFAGTFDALWPSERVMLDMKTHKGEARWSAFPQMAMYGLAAEQMGLIDGPIEKQIVVIPRPDGEYEMYDDKFVDDGIVAPILELYRYRRAWGPRA
jgi:hypothetical protein